MPVIFMTFISSLNIIIPQAVATSGSRYAIIEAVPASILDSPFV